MKFIGKLFTGFGVIAACAALTITACNKSASSTDESEKVSIYLTDDAGLYDNVFIDIRYVEVKLQQGYKNEEHVGDKDDDDDHFDDNDKDSDNDHTSKDQYGKWDTLAIRPGIYDILKLRNGVDTLFAQGTIKGRVRKIRLTLGDKNSIVKAGVTSPLNLHPGINNYVYVRIHNRHHESIGVNHLGFWIDFDIANSIIEQNAHFFLKPLLKPFCDKQFGKVQGKVFPAEAHPLVKIFNVNDGGTAIPEKSGEYKIRGLAEGTYKVTFTGVNGYRDTFINDIKVAKDKETKIPDVTLRK
ncbi:MAG: hypothetical protein JWQ09_2276 [Segetibacter sp.]|nr:hypothetical protein [Segetibacter sp.]